MAPCSSSSSTSALLWWIMHCKKWRQIPTHIPPCSTFSSTYALLWWIMHCKHCWQIPTYMAPRSSSSSTSALFWWITHCKKMAANPYLYATMLFLLFHLCTLMVNYALQKMLQIPTFMPQWSSSSSTYALFWWIKHCKKMAANPYLYATMLYLLCKLCTLIVNYAL